MPSAYHHGVRERGRRDRDGALTTMSLVEMKEKSEGEIWSLGAAKSEPCGTRIGEIDEVRAQKPPKGDGDGDGDGDNDSDNSDDDLRSDANGHTDSARPPQDSSTLTAPHGPMSTAPGLSSILAPSQASTRSAATGDDLGTYREDACAPPSADLLASPSTSSSASAAAARSLALYLGAQPRSHPVQRFLTDAGFLFRRPSKLFRPSRGALWS